MELPLPTKHPCSLALRVCLCGLKVIGDVLIAFSGWFTEDSDAIVIVFPDDDAFAIKQPHINASVLLRFLYETFFILSHYEDKSEEVRRIFFLIDNRKPGLGILPPSLIFAQFLSE